MDTTGITTVALRDFLYIIFKRKAQILIFFCVTICTVTVGTLLIRPTYQANSRILVKIGRENLYVPTVPAGGNLNPVVTVSRQEQLVSEIEILKSRSLLEKVVESMGAAVIYPNLHDEDQGVFGALFSGTRGKRQSAADTAVLKLQKAVNVEGIKNSNVIEVKYRHKDPLMAATVLNSLINSYLSHHLDVHRDPQSYKFFQEQSQMLKDKLRKAEEKLRGFEKEHAVTSVEQERVHLLRQQAELRAALNQTLSQEAETENRIRQLRKQFNATPETIRQGEEVDLNPHLISTLESRLVELELKEKGLLAKYTEQSRLVVGVRDEIRMVRDKLGEQETKRYGSSRFGPNPTYQSLREELFRNEVDLKALRAKKKIQIMHTSEYKKKLEDLAQSELGLSELQHEVDLDRQNYQRYLTKFEEARISNAMDTEKIANVSLIEPARAPLKPVSPKVLLNLVLGAFLGVFGALGLAFFLEYLDDSMEKAEDVEEYLQLPVLASIPELKS